MAVKFPKSNRNFTKNLVKRHKLVPYLDKYLGTEVEQFTFTYEPKTKDDAWHPSGHCCPLPGALYEIASTPEEEKDWGTAMLKTFMVGHFWHQLLQKAVLDLGFADESAIERRGLRDWGDHVDIKFSVPSDVPIEAKFRPYHYATGSGDIAPCSIPNFGDYVVDFKTMSSHQYKGNGVPDWAANKYEAQINIYMDFFDLEKGLIVAVCKDSPHEFKEFEYVRNQSLIDGIYAKWEFVGACLEAGEAPDARDDLEWDMTGAFTGPVAQ